MENETIPSPTRSPSSGRSTPLAGAEARKPANPIADKLAEARALIERDGWVQGEFCVGDRVCAVGAVNKALTGDATQFVGPSPVMDALAAAIGDPPAITHWNDAPGRTQAEVLAAFDHAIELARGETA